MKAFSAVPLAGYGIHEGAGPGPRKACPLPSRLRRDIGRPLAAFTSIMAAIVLIALGRLNRRDRNA